MTDYHYLFKYILIGDANVGKSCLMMQFIENKFKSYLDPTVGVEFGAKQIKIKDKKLKLQIWDTAGQENFRSITRAYFRGAIGGLLVFDLTKRETFQNLDRWLEEARMHSSRNIQLVLIGNKKDLENRQVTTEEAMNFAQQNNLEYFETSAKDDINVDNAFKQISKEILGKIDSQQIDARKEFGIKQGVLAQNENRQNENSINEEFGDLNGTQYKNIDRKENQKKESCCQLNF